VGIVGGGFAGLYTAKRLKRQPAHVTLLGRRNHHLFQPFLYQDIIAGLVPGDIGARIHSLPYLQHNTTILLADAEAISLQHCHVLLTDRVQGSYDLFVLATGVCHSHFGRNETLKTLKSFFV
jgi:NADH dehydrogenase